MTSFAACLLLVFSIMLRVFNLNDDAISRDLTGKPPAGQEQKTTKATIHDVDNNVFREYKSEEKVNTLVEYINKIKMETPIIDIGDDTGNENEEDEKLIIEIIWKGGDIKKFVIGSKVILEDDSVFYLSKEDYEGFIKLIEGMESD